MRKIAKNVRKLKVCLNSGASFKPAFLGIQIESGLDPRVDLIKLLFSVLATFDYRGKLRPGILRSFGGKGCVLLQIYETHARRHCFLFKRAS